MKLSPTVCRTPTCACLGGSLLRSFWAGLLLICVGLPLSTASGLGLDPLESGLALRAPAAPAKQNQSAFEIVRRERWKAEPEVNAETESQEMEEIPAYPGWKGYLQEKGPSRVVVEAEQKREIQQLDDAIWQLIMGDPASPDLDESTSVESAKSANTTLEGADSSGQQLETSESLEGELQAQAGEGSDPSSNPPEVAALDDSAETYRRLMELFTQPVWTTPARDLDDAEGRVSFRIPQTDNQSSVIRQGSRARFEIRRQ